MLLDEHNDTNTYVINRWCDYPCYNSYDLLETKFQKDLDMLGKDIPFYKKTPQEIQAIIEYLIREKE